MNTHLQKAIPETINDCIQELEGLKSKVSKPTWNHASEQNRVISGIQLSIVHLNKKLEEYNSYKRM